jgi:hypothetical protein
MNNETYQYTLTQEEATLIEDIRAMVSNNKICQTDEQIGDELMEKYMDMDDNEFIDHYAEAVGDDTILAVLQDTMGAHEKWDTIWDAIDEDVIDELFENYVSEVTRRQLFLESQDRFELCSQLVDLKMDGKWTSDN